MPTEQLDKQSTQLDEQSIHDWLIRRAATQLEVPPRDIDGSASLMSLGIDSLDLIGIAGEIAEFLDRDLRAEVLWECETIDVLARYLASPTSILTSPAQRSAIERQCYLVEHQRGDSGVRPLISVGFRDVGQHATTGLSADIPVQSVVGLINNTEIEARPIQTIASDCVDAILEEHPHGPLALAGFSWCGFVAYEMACQLTKLDRDVWLVLLEPAPFSTRDPRENSGQKMRRHADVLRNSDGYLEQIRYCVKKAVVAKRVIVRHARQQLLRPYYVRRMVGGKSVPSGFRWHVLEPTVERRICEHPRSVFHGTTRLFGRPEWLGIHAESWINVLGAVQTVDLSEVASHRRCVSDPGWVNEVSVLYRSELAIALTH